jgi:putative transposase
MLTLNYTYRLYPDSSQVQLLNEWLETCRISYNYALRELKDWIASRKCSLDRCSLESEYIMSADYPFPGYGSPVLMVISKDYQIKGICHTPLQ